MIKDPYVFEFLGIPEDKPLLESDLEEALVRQIEKFLLELKTVKLMPEAVGQLNTYLNYYATEVNEEGGLLFIGVEEIDNKETGEKAVPKRPISGIDQSMIETTENKLKQFISHVHPKPVYQFIDDEIDVKKNSSLIFLGGACRNVLKIFMPLFNFCIDLKHKKSYDTNKSYEWRRK